MPDAILVANVHEPASLRPGGAADSGRRQDRTEPQAKARRSTMPGAQGARPNGTVRRHFPMNRARGALKSTERGAINTAPGRAGLACQPVVAAVQNGLKRCFDNPGGGSIFVLSLPVE
ncbi:hypothetical protein [Pseudoduganella sp.]|uniref:hypothetical protein n=1 Tax=Pseudoduganella sp. TaxID=1880898 RepID=UPI0035B447C9